jgi:hypothetical protein
VLTASERSEIQHFIDVGEYGLALETAVGIYREENKSPSKEALVILDQLSDAMSIDLRNRGFPAKS